MSIFRKYSRKPLTANENKISDLLDALDVELSELDHTDSPHAFFTAHKDAVSICGDIPSYKPGNEIENKVLRTLHYLFGDKTEITNRFIDRSSTGGRLSYDIDVFVEHKADMTDESYEYFLSLTGIDELVYTYCSVTFGSTRTYDYICDIREVKVGDEVVVPVGEEDTERIAKVVALNEYRYDEVPYPVAKTKRVIAKYGCGL